MALFIDAKKKATLHDFDGRLSRRHLRGDQGFGIVVSGILHMTPSIRSAHNQMHTQKKCSQLNVGLMDDDLQVFLNSFPGENW